MTAVVRSQLLKRLQNVRHEQAAVVESVFRVVDNGVRGALFEGLRCKLIAVEMAAFEGEKQATRRQLPGVGAYDGVLPVNGIEFRYGEHGAVDSVKLQAGFCSLKFTFDFAISVFGVIIVP